MFNPASPTMPGAFSPAVTVAEPFDGARRRSVYHPPTPSTAPQSPSAMGSSSYFPQQPNMAARQNENQRPLLLNRKRSRQDTIPGGTALPQLGDFISSSGTALGDITMRSRTTSHNFYPEIPPSPMPFVNTQYALRGGLDTPTTQQAQYFDQNTESEFSDVNYRRTLATGRRTASGRHIGGGEQEGLEREYHSFARLPSSASLESNGRPRVASPEVEPSPGWGRLAAGVVGGVVGTVVGKMWQFCKAGAFVGFNAGGGEGYQIDAKHTKEAEIADDYSTTQCEFPDPPPAYTPLSEYHEPVEESLCMVDYPTPDCQTASQRPAKRRQISHETTQNNNDAAIERSWVVVPIPSAPSSPAPTQPSNYSRNPRISQLPSRMSLNNTSPARRSQAASAFPQPASASRAPARLGAAQRRPLLHTRQSNSVSSTGSPARVGFPTRPSTATASYASPTPERPSTASYASPRNSFASSTGGGYQSRIPVLQPRSGASTPTGTPGRSQIPLPNRRDARSSVASNRGSHTQNILSPAAIEAQKWRQAKKAADAEEDVAIKRFNKQLQDMIREGQEALSTRFEVRDAEAADDDEEMEDISGEVLSKVLGRR